jgi:hypothetical protein
MCVDVVSELINPNLGLAPGATSFSRSAAGLAVAGAAGASGASRAGASGAGAASCPGVS